MINMDLLKNKVEKDILKHVEAIEEIFSLEECVRISEENDLDIVGFINGLTTKVLSSSGNFDFEDNELSDEISKFIEKFSIKLDKHPIDFTFYLIKMLSDILVQLTIIEEFNTSEDFNENNKMEVED